MNLIDNYMSDNNKQILPNSLEIIERFGGIRPMATKMDVPVTTVQGWKKREAIPENRKDEIVKAAAAHDVKLDDLLNAPKVEVAPARPIEAVPVEKPVEKPVEQPQAKAPVEPQPQQQQQEQAAPRPQPINPRVSAAQKENVMAAQQTMQHTAQARSTQSLINGIVGGVSIAALAGVLGLLFLTGPKVKETDKQAEQIAALEQQLAEVSQKQSLFQKIVPEDLDKRIGEIKEQTAQMKQNVNTLAEQASVISKTVMGAEGGSIAQRLQSLEGEIGRFAELSGSSDLAGFVAKLSTMQQSMEGQQQLQSAMDELWNAVNTMKTAPSENGEAAMGEALSQTSVEGNSVLSETFGSLEQKDLKAAAMLMALAQLRGTLGRDNASFEKDLALMQKLVGSEDDQLNDAIAKLAPQAKYGVLTVGGLSKQLKGLGGDIVSASLQGEDVSWQEKAKARFNNVMKVEKNGELITGTETQERIEAAQYYLDHGDVESAYIILNELKGPARITADGFIQELRKTAMAEQLETMLTGKVMQNVMGFDLSALKEGLMNGNALSGLNIDGLGQGLGNLQNIDAQSLQGLVDSFERMMPQRELIVDPVSGYKFLSGDNGLGGLPKGQTIPNALVPKSQ